MGEFVNNQEEFKPPQVAFVQELDALEKYNHTNTDAIARMSLFNQFDPLATARSNSSTKVPTIVKVEDEGSEELVNGDQKYDQNMADLNQSGTLVEFASPKPTITQINVNGYIPVDDSSLVNNSNSNQSKDLGEDQARLKSLFEQLVYINEETVRMAQQRYDSIAEEYKKEIEGVNLMKTQNEEDINRYQEDINNVEKNYYDIHSRYENLRTVNKGMESHYKEVILDLTSKLKEKDDECRKWMMAAESSNQRLQNAANNESVSLKAQIKLLEMKVGSLQSTNEQQNKENQELAHLVNELINNGKN